MKILTYHCDDEALPALKWISYIFKDGTIIPIRFNAETKVEVTQKAKFWFESQTAPKSYQQDTTEESFAEYLDTKPVVEPKKIFPTVTRSAAPGPGRGHGNVGRIWVVNRDTKDRKRVHESELSDYIGRGYMKGKKI